MVNSTPFNGSLVTESNFIIFKPESGLFVNVTSVGVFVLISIVFGVSSNI